MKRWMIGTALAVFVVAAFGGWLLGDVLIRPETTKLAHEYPEQPPCVAGAASQGKVRWEPVPADRISDAAFQAAVSGGRLVMEERPEGERFPQWDLAGLFVAQIDDPRVRRIRAGVLAWRLSRGLPEERMLDLLVNLAPYGDGTCGIEAASMRFFHKPALMLTSEEGAVLAARMLVPSGTDRTAEMHEIRYLAGRIHQDMVRDGVAVQDFEGRLERLFDKKDSPVGLPSGVPPGVASPGESSDGVPPLQEEPAVGLPEGVRP